MAAGLRCGSTTIKYLLFFFNFLFTLCGLAIVILGATALAQTLKGGNPLNSTLIFLIVVGGFIFLVAFLGCCGAVRESHCMLVTFSCLLMTIIVCEVIAAILVFVNVGSVDSTVEDVFKLARDGQKEAMDTVNAVQSSLKCCGLKDASFWTKIPDSCCAEGKCTQGNAYKDGCQDVFKKTITVFGKAIGAVAIAVAVVEVLGVWFALALAGEIKRIER